ncbi:UNVERIFIED_CONTAM: Wall-associated receptor kinase [Sesamum angustifolium]|uniref:Wall-associated receptor kinase n=1 Tax=Sesamum angustifolium TaxID=2727405 RepID=A0AAW2L4A1_9LAMI
MILMIMMISSLPPTLSVLPPDYLVAKPNCTDRCGDVSIPFPFGTTPDCYGNYSFFVTCNQTIHPGPKLFLQDSDIEITDISLDGQLTVLPYIARECYAPNGSRDGHGASLTFSDFIVNNTANKFTIVGCDAYAFISGGRLDNRNYTTGCMALCTDDMVDLVEGPARVWAAASSPTFLKIYAFFAAETAFNFSRQTVADLKNVTKLPMVANWAIGINMTCKEAEKNSSDYACRSSNSTCYEPVNGSGYRCSCQEGYQGNPYLFDGCQDINECELRKCRYGCQNTNGNFTCLCPKGHEGDGENCSLRQSVMLKLGAVSSRYSKHRNQIGIAFGIIILLLAATCLCLALKRRSFNKMKQTFFLQNGGIVLQEKLITRQISPESLKIFTSSDLQRATNDFDNNMIVGQGGFGTVYKGFLPDNSIVAIKKSKRIDPDQVEQFINEVLVLSQINHRNVVRLLGCCLETEVPLLVFGVVLLELLTGRKAITFDKPEEEKNLSNFFLSVLKQEHLLQILDDNILGNDQNREQIIEVAMLAQGCLNVRGDDRPSMKEVAMELEGLRLGGKHSWVQNECNAEEMESLLGEGYNGHFIDGDGDSTSVGFDSLRSHDVLPMSGGR